MVHGAGRVPADGEQRRGADRHGADVGRRRRAGPAGALRERGVERGVRGHREAGGGDVCGQVGGANAGGRAAVDGAGGGAVDAEYLHTEWLPE